MKVAQYQCQEKLSQAWKDLGYDSLQKLDSDFLRAAFEEALLETQFAADAVPYIVKLRSGMNPRFGSPD